MRKYFGTDGVRGIANEMLTPELAFQLGRCGGYALTRNRREQAKVVVGKDTRISGDMLEAALSAGLMSVGIEVIRLGIIPTPGVAYMTKKLGADAGVMISASHNPYEDNGIKFFGSDGYKLPDEIEEEIEAFMENNDPLVRPISNGVGTIEEFYEGRETYMHFLKSTVNHSFDGLKIVVDCANGAASSVATRVFTDLGAHVITIHAKPNGTNINVACGSTHVESLQETVLREKAHLGLAFDGDADRLIAVDEKGNAIDGDYIMYICGMKLKNEGKLHHNTIVGTVMSNLGLKKAFEREGIRFIEAKVGDRYVLEEMKKGNYVFGGEQSGHLVFHHYNTTGDGLLSAIQLTDTIVANNQSLSELAKGMKKFPQLLVNVKVKDKTKWETDERIQRAIEEETSKLNGNGRILVRASGTESLVRVMAEGEDFEQITGTVSTLSKLIEQYS